MGMTQLQADKLARTAAKDKSPVKLSPRVTAVMAKQAESERERARAEQQARTKERFDRAVQMRKDKEAAAAAKKAKGSRS